MTIIKHGSQRVGIFIDTQNLYHSAKNLYNAKVNFQKLVKEVIDGRVLVRAIAYVIQTESGEENSFFDALVKAGIETKIKDLQTFSSGAKKADWDLGIAVDAMGMSSKLDVVVLVTGDGDFVPVVEYIKFTGCQVEVVTFGKSCSSLLRNTADDFFDLSEDKRKFLIR